MFISQIVTVTVAGQERALAFFTEIPGFVVSQA
jgi:hypothetical protein